MNKSIHQHPERTHGGRIPCLDGLRALSIFGVAFAHLQGTQGFPAQEWMRLPGDLGNLGVRVFFVISGFLITHLLIQESRANGTISLKNFYIRRTFRIFPAFYAYLGVIAVMAMAGLIALEWSDFGFAATYLINFVEKKDWVVGHLWSLAVEEQFYLIWPLTVVLAGWGRSTMIALGIIAIAPVLRIACWYLMPEWQVLITKAFPTVCDSIASGCALACLRGRMDGWKHYRWFVSSRFFWLIPLVIFISNSLASHTRPDYLVGQTVRNVGIALCLDWCLRNPASTVGRFLNLRFMIWLGGLSYSFYLWQQLFLNRNSSAIWCAFPLNIILALMFALISFHGIERPFLKVRAKWFPGKKLVSKKSDISAPLPDASV
ncbi:MAG: acyltransferase [Verrucomicrobiota bacterium]